MRTTFQDQLDALFDQLTSMCQLAGEAITTATEALGAAGLTHAEKVVGINERISACAGRVRTRRWPYWRCRQSSPGTTEAVDATLLGRFYDASVITASRSGAGSFSSPPGNSCDSRSAGRGLPQAPSREYPGTGTDPSHPLEVTGAVAPVSRTCQVP
jgi:hypothetical protein